MSLKITMFGHESEAVELQVTGETMTEVCVAAIKKHSELFGDEYLNEMLEGLAYLASGESVYERRDFSNPEANFDLTLEGRAS